MAAVERRVKWVWSCARLNAQLKEKAINRQGNVFPTHPERSGSDLSSPWCIFLGPLSLKVLSGDLQGVCFTPQHRERERSKLKRLKLNASSKPLLHLFFHAGGPFVHQSLIKYRQRPSLHHKQTLSPADEKAFNCHLDVNVGGIRRIRVGLAALLVALT